VRVQAVDPQRRVVFLNTDALGAPEAKAGDALCNEGEAALVGCIIGALGALGLPDTGIAAVSPYRSQVRACACVCAHAWRASCRSRSTRRQPAENGCRAAVRL
jgi:hypothetical protein